MALNVKASAPGSGDGKASALVSGDAEWRQEFLRDLNAVRQRGKSVHLGEEQIDELFFRSKWIKKTSPSRLFFRQMIGALKYMIYGLSVLSCLLITYNQFPSEYIEKTMTSWDITDYNTTRLFRLFAVRTGLRDWMADQNWDTNVCFLDNPLYVKPKPPCSVECHNASFNEYQPVHDEDLRKIKYRELRDLFIYRSSAPSDISLTDLKEVLLPHSDEVVKRAEVIHTTVDGFETMDDLLKTSNAEELLDGADKALVVLGTSHYNVSRHFRSLFRRAPFIPLGAEIGLNKKLFVYQDGKKFRLKEKDDKQAHNWIHQARGSYCYLVRQLNECTKKDRKQLKLKEEKKKKKAAESQSASGGSDDGAKDIKTEDNNNNNNEHAAKKLSKFCPTFSFRLEEGDFAYYNGYFWKAEARPCDEEEEEAVERDEGEGASAEGGVDENVAGKDYGLVYIGTFG